MVRERRLLRDAVVREVSALGLPRGSSLLDIGYGAGWTAELLHKDFDYLGLDLGEASIKAAQAWLPSAKFLAADFSEYQEDPARNDIALCIDTIAYIAEQAAADRKMANTLKPRGWLVLTTVNPFVYSRLKWVGPPSSGQVRRWLSRSALLDLVRSNGFELVKTLTVAPTGDSGWLRLVNSRKLGALLGRPHERLKEAVGLGQFRMVIARKI